MLPKALKAKNGRVINKKLDTYYYLNDNVDYSKLTPKQMEIVNLCLEKKKVIRKELVDIHALLIDGLINHDREKCISYFEKHYGFVEQSIG